MGATLIGAARAAASAPSRASAWSAAGGVVLLLGALYWRTAWSMAETWWRSETFAHGLVVVPVVLWLGWQRRDVLAQLPIRPFLPAVVLVLGGGVLWLLADLAVVAAGKQFGFVFMLQGALIAVLGWHFARAFAFPLAFLLFAVPFGEFLLPTLMSWTADFTVAALHFTGIPVYREGMDFVIPSGSWSVVEACSGIRYLIASCMGGTLFAYLAYRSPWRRAGFVVLAVVVPILANWVRAYSIVMIGHLSDNKLAAGVDHLIYGWVFFGVVVFVLFWIGSLWREPQHDATRRTVSQTIEDAGSQWPRAVLAAATASIAFGVWPLLAQQLEVAGDGGDVALAAVTPPAGLEVSPTHFTEWKPRYQGYRSDASHTFVNGPDSAGLYLAYYRAQSGERDLISSSNVLAPSDDPVWRTLPSGSERLDWNGAPIAFRRDELTSASLRLLVLHAYWVDGRVTASAQHAKILLALAKLRGRGDDAALIVLYAPKRGDRADWMSLARFTEAMAPSIERALAATRAARRD